MGVDKGVLQLREQERVNEILIDGEIRIERIQHRLAGPHTAVIGRVNILAQNIGPSARTANRHSPRNNGRDRRLYGCPFPKIERLALSPASDEDRIGIADDLRHRWIHGCRTVGDHEG